MKVSKIKIISLAISIAINVGIIILFICLVKNSNGIESFDEKIFSDNPILDAITAVAVGTFFSKLIVPVEKVIKYILMKFYGENEINTGEEK